jgi:hypothetical protein
MENKATSEVAIADLFIPLLLVAGAFLFYFATLAPTVLWGDNAFFQRSAYEHILKPDAGGHWLWLQFAEVFAKAPWGNVAFRVNLLSAVAAVLTLLILYFAILALGLNWKSALLAAVCLAVSHTFWMHAVRAEVYTVFTMMMAMQLWLWFSWRPHKAWPIYVAALLSGMTLLGHQMALLLIPAALYLLWRQRHWLSGREWMLFWLFALVGFASFLLVLFRQMGTTNIANGIWRYFTQVDVDFSHDMFGFSPSQLAHDTGIWIALWGLQFIGVAGLLAIYGLFGDTLKQVPWQCLLILYATGLFFAFSYRVNDQFVFYLPSYVAVAFFIASGFQRIQSQPLYKRHSGAMAIAIFVLAMAVPVAAYAALPHLLDGQHLNPLNIRTLPGRPPNQYFLWPGSGNDMGAKEFATNALESLPQNSVLIADHTPLEPLRYLQEIDGVRSDVQLIKIEPLDDLARVIKSIPAGHAIYLADNNPHYYDLASLAAFCVVPAGNVYELIETKANAECPTP